MLFRRLTAFYLEACAESKVKCNLQYPCSKCSSRGRECIFINDPEASRNKRNAAKRAMQQAAAAKAVTDPTTSETPSTMQSKPSPPYTSLLMQSPSPTLSLDSRLLSLAPFELPGLSTSSSSSIASSGSSPRSDLLERGEFAPSFEPSAFDSLGLDNQLHRLFPNSTSCFDNFAVQSSFSPSSAPFQELSTWLDGGEQLPKYGESDIISYPQASQEVKIESQDSLQDYGPPGLPFSLNTIINSTGGLSDSSGLSNAPGPTAEELEHYRVFNFFLHPKAYTNLIIILQYTSFSLPSVLKYLLSILLRGSQKVNLRSSFVPCKHVGLSSSKRRQQQPSSMIL